ncbi:MAG: hypothetical protein KDI33_20985 [Halioglobus sp.]|nr:hypothetical protein [Halioglobus sp.]
MDPVSYLFSAYLNSFQTATANHLTESIGTEIKAVVIEYEGTKIPFQYQMWRIREPSVCANLTQNTADYSQCTVKASELFNKLCTEIPTKKNADWKYSKTKNMYCNAAMTYQPMIASISSESPESELLQAKKKCNAATVEAMGSSDPAAIGRRDRTCQKYNELKSTSL